MANPFNSGSEEHAVRNRFPSDSLDDHARRMALAEVERALFWLARVESPSGDDSTDSGALAAISARLRGLGLG